MVVVKNNVAGEGDANGQLFGCPNIMDGKGEDLRRLVG